jgi:hypothetical protein
MPRMTHHGWYCGAPGCNQKNSSDSKECSRCGFNRFQPNAQIHASDRAVIYYNPATGEHRTPPRADLPIPEVYKNQGFERKEIMSMIAYEKETGIIHEASNFNTGNEPMPESPATQPDKRSIEVVAEDMREAMASGPWTINGLTLDQI